MSVFTTIKNVVKDHKTVKDHVRLQLPPEDFINLLQETNTHFTLNDEGFEFTFLCLGLDLNAKVKIVKVTVNFNNDLTELVII